MRNFFIFFISTRQTVVKCSEIFELNRVLNILCKLFGGLVGTEMSESEAGST